MEMNEKQRHANRRRNFFAKSLHEPRFGPRVVDEKRRHKLDAIHEREADEDLADFINRLGLGEKE